jgi:hypothetical protein
MRTLAVLSMSLILACAGGGTQAADAPAPSTQAAGGDDDCGGLYALDVHNDGDDEVWFWFSDAKLLQPAQQIGRLRGKDATTLFFRSPETPSVWAQTRTGSRVFITDRAGLQRYRIRVALRCDKP